MKNKWKYYCDRVKKIKKIYLDTKAKYAPDEELQMSSINMKAEPFEKGYFTLAVAGRVSSGKSTFINALIGEYGLLPSDFNQSTCILTEVIHSDKPYLKVIYDDDKKIEQISGKNKIKDKLKNIVAIHEGNKKIKSANPSKVVLGYPIPEEFKGWKIIDTPGVGAIGGIEDKTYDYLTDRENNIDAIIFIHKGTETAEDKELNNLIKKAFENLTEDAQKRLFLVITHAAVNSYESNRSDSRGKIVDLFTNNSQYFDKKRVLEVDNLTELLISYAKKHQSDFSKLLQEYNDNDFKGELFVPDEWKENDWKFVMDILRAIDYRLLRQKLEIIEEDYNKALREKSNFDEFRRIINDFVESEKDNAYEEIINLIKEDIGSIKESRKNDICLLQDILKEGVESNQALEKQKKDLEKKKEELENKYREIERKYSKTYVDGRFEKFKHKIKELGTCQNISSAKSKYIDICNNVEEEKKRIVDEIQSKYKEEFKKSIGNSLPLPDFNTIEKKYYNKYKNSKEEKGLWGSIKRFFHLGGRTLDENAQLKDFVKDLRVEFSTKINDYIGDLSDNISEMGIKIKDDLEESKNNQVKKNEELAKNNNDIDMCKESIEKLNNEVKEIERIESNIKDQFTKSELC
jgi:hypothetical protein